MWVCTRDIVYPGRKGNRPHRSTCVSVFRNTSTAMGSVAFAARVDYITGANPHSVSIGDLDGDGKSDMVAANAGSNTVSILRNTSTIGSIGFAGKVDYATGTTPNSVSIGDLDGDGKADLAVSNTGVNNSSVSGFRNTSTVGGAILYTTNLGSG